MSVRFEQINGQLCRMVEPTPLTPESNFPCVVRLVNDKSKRGGYNRWTHRHLLKCVDIIECVSAKWYMPVTSRLGGINIEVIEIIGYPVADGSADWALYQMMQGMDIFNMSYHGGDARFCIRNGRIMQTDRNSWADYCDVSSSFFPPAGIKDGWQLYEPEAEPKPEPAYKVGDWVEYMGYQRLITAVPVGQSLPDNKIWDAQDILGNECMIYTDNITRKLDPSVTGSLS